MLSYIDTKDFQMKIMVVDDEELNRDLFSDIFSDEENVEEVLCCPSGVEALDQVSEFQPDVIILDIMMPHLNGFEFCKTLRSKKEIKQPRVIMVTGMSGDDVMDKGMASGADKLFFKPLNVNILRNEVLNS
ncbi:MAG: response regulator [Bdellovibrionales bacterium]|nr:response regulator [Bdellovibrionales bacterium]